MPGTNFENDSEGYDPQDQAEALDETQTAGDDSPAEMRTFEELPDVEDLTQKAGDRDDDEALAMDADEFEEFRRSLLEPMIARHEEMFPLLHQRLRARAPTNDSPAGERSSWPEPDWIAPESRPFASEPRAAAAVPKKSTIDRYGPCPCGSGKKFKFCCGAKGR